MDFNQQAIEKHRELRGKLSVEVKMPLRDQADLSIAYTPGVGAVSLEAAKSLENAYQLTIKGNTVAVVSDGSAVLGLGNIGPYGALPVMEGKCALFKTFANIDAWPICLDTQDTEEIIKTVRYIAPVFGGINLEDISAPRCFEIEERLQDLGIPVFHDDQHGTAIVTAAAMLNAAKVVGKKFEDMTCVILGAGAAGVAVTRILMGLDIDQKAMNYPGIKDVICIDRQGIIYEGRGGLDSSKAKLATYTNRSKKTGGAAEALEGADVFIGLSGPGLVTAEMISRMAKDSIVLAMANPIPEIMPDEARAAGARVIGTGRSDFPNQVNNSVAFPGVFRGALDAGAARVTPAMKVAAAIALAAYVTDPSEDRIIPSAFEPGVAACVAEAVADAWRRGL